MPRRSRDLHGNAPDESRAALLLIDVINDFEFPEGPRMLPHALAMADALAALKAGAKRAGIPAIYVNDNFGRWQSDWRATIEHVVDGETRGAPVAKRLLPEDDDYFVLKPKNSAFYASSLDVLLEHLGSRTLILTGIATNSCILFTAHDAYLREFRVVVPRDCVVAHSAEEQRDALELLSRTVKADIDPSTDLDLAALAAESD